MEKDAEPADGLNNLPGSWTFLGFGVVVTAAVVVSCRAVVVSFGAVVVVSPGAMVVVSSGVQGGGTRGLPEPAFPLLAPWPSTLGPGRGSSSSRRRVGAGAGSAKSNNSECRFVLRRC